MPERTTTLKVMEADPNNVGKKIVALDVDTRNILGLGPNDCVHIKGKKETLAKIWPARPSDEGTQIIRMDSFSRKNAGISLGDAVTVKKANVQQAKKVTFAPTQEINASIDQYTRNVKKIFLMKPVMAGEEVMFSVFGSPVFLIIQSTQPKGAVLITDETEVLLLNEVVDPNMTNVCQVSYEDIGGIKKQLSKIREMIELPLRHPEFFEYLGIEPPKGVLLYGPPGTGKTLIAKAVATESGAHIITLKGPEIMSRYVGGAEEKLRAMFKEAEENSPAIIFIDEIDAIAPIREEVSGDVEKRVVAQLLSLMDGMEARGQTIVIAATNRPNSIDTALRRPGRFDREIEIGVPDRDGRKEIIEILSRDIPLGEDFDIDLLVSRTHGFVGADLSALVKEAAMQALRRNLDGYELSSAEVPQEDLNQIKINMRDFDNALLEVRPSGLRELFVEIPDVHWENIGGLESTKHELKKMVEWPLKYYDVFDKAGVPPTKGILLYGPPGTGKTMLAKAIANECESNFISIKGPEIFSKWLGDSERMIRNIFLKARQTAPCIVFFDEIDAVAPKRAFDTNQTTYRVVNQLLTEIDGLNSAKGVVFLAATNKLHNLDNALLRPGRIDLCLNIGLPEEKERLDILKKLSSKMKLENNDLLLKVAKETEGFSGADLNGILREAALLTLENGNMNPDSKITIKEFQVALDNAKKSKETQESYNDNDEESHEEKEEKGKKYIR